MKTQTTKNLNKILTLFSFIFLGSGIAKTALAVCPVCIVAVGSGLGLARWIGVDDTVSSMWIGALLFSLSIWTIVWMKKKGWGFEYIESVIPITYYILTLAPLWYFDIMGHPLNTIFGIDKIIFGATVGTLVFWGASWLYDYLKQKNNGRPYFQYQKVVLPVSILLIFSLLFNFLII